jgi:excisionase family DNA binding protein
MTALSIKETIFAKAESSIGEQLLLAFNEVRKAHPILGKVDEATFLEFRQIFLHRILNDKIASENLRALLTGTVAFGVSQEPKSPNSEVDSWLKTDDAAKRMGFSRPYVVALIDAGEFGDGSIKTPSGHRRVKASAIVKWMSDHGVSHPLTLEHEAVLDAVDGPAFFEQPKALSKTAKSRLMKSIQAQKAESLKYKPAHR